MIAQMLGIDPAQIETMIANAETTLRDLDSRLEAIENQSRTQTVLLAMVVAELYGIRTGHPADVAGVLADARGTDGPRWDATAMDAARPEPDPAGPLPTIPIVHSGKSPAVDWEPSEDDGIS